ncbi:GNAT family N-acetyltransferase [Pontiellaceae bacterium B12227]|nr:GNAT family N-acetyltransferase [Pontiellaceae bacterium B12227]
MLTGCQKQDGYASGAYAESLSEFGELIQLPRSGGYLLKRRIAGTTDYDVMGSYPLFCCQDWDGVPDDLDELPEDIVSVSLVADPYGSYTLDSLRKSFDVVNPFKEHFIVDLSRPIEEIGSRGHVKQARKALKKVRVEVCKDPAGFSRDWNKLYNQLRLRHKISGIRAFSERAFVQQLSMPEVVVHQAFFEGEVIGAQIFYIQDDVVHCHLGAVNDIGYKMAAFYALDLYSFQFFSGAARKLDLGGGVGFSGTGEDGLSRYKRGWSSETKPVTFCGRITNPSRYAELTAARQLKDTHYFPAYRDGEFS